MAGDRYFRDEMHVGERLARLAFGEPLDPGQSLMWVFVECH